MAQGAAGCKFDRGAEARGERSTPARDAEAQRPEARGQLLHEMQRRRGQRRVGEVNSSTRCNLKFQGRRGLGPAVTVKPRPATQIPRFFIAFRILALGAESRTGIFGNLRSESRNMPKIRAEDSSIWSDSRSTPKIRAEDS